MAKTPHPHPQTTRPGPVQLRFDRTPSNWRAMVSSLMAGRPAQAPTEKLGVQLRATWQGARAPTGGLARYNMVCALPATGKLPLLYVHAMAMPLHMAILSHPQFPLRLLGLVHWSNTITSVRPIAAGEVLDLECTLNGITPGERGQSFVLNTTVRVQGEVVWSEVSTFLSPLAKSKSGQATKAAPVPDATDWGAPVAQWPLAGNAGRRFAGPSGDWNPIHMSALSARLFGYPRAIAHGLFSAARCLALLQTHVAHATHIGPGGPVRLDLRFKRPLLIPGRVALHTAPDGDATRFVLRVQPGDEPHIEGRLERAR